MFGLADRLHKTIGEIEHMTEDEFVGWLAHYQAQEKARKNRE